MNADSLPYYGSSVARGWDLEYPARRFICDYWPQRIDRASKLDEIQATLRDCWENLINNSAGSFKDMLLTHPPCRKVKVQPDTRLDDRPHCWWSEGVSADDWVNGVRVGGFLYAASRISIDQRTDTFQALETDFVEVKNTVDVIGGEAWRVVKKSVDIMTGWEMLKMLGTSPEELDTEAFW